MHKIRVVGTLVMTYPLNLHRWFSPRTIKQIFVPPTHFVYPFLGDE